MITRFAPSPTGPLHLGHGWSALLAHDAARARGGQFLVRIEDIDATRSRPEHADAIMADLAWLGLSPDAPPLLQSTRAAAHAAALKQLIEMGVAYRCWCTRTEISASASAPHDGEAVLYPGTCKGRADPGDDLPFCWRLDSVRAARLAGACLWQDAFGPLTLQPGIIDPLWKERRAALMDGTDPDGRPWVGLDALNDLSSRPAAAALWQSADPSVLGDVVIARKDVQTSYHLAVVVDDAHQGITDIVRGRDLQPSTHVHRLLQALLGLPVPSYHHHRLIVGSDGTRLAKRKESPTIADLRAGGADPAALVAAMRNGAFPVGFALEGA